MAEAHGLDLVLLVAPTTPEARMTRIGQSSRGFTYLVSVTGVTGERAQMEHGGGLVHKLKQSSSVPVAVGFGISGADQVRQVRSWGADGVIVGGALVEAWRRDWGDRRPGFSLPGAAGRGGLIERSATSPCHPSGPAINGPVILMARLFSGEPIHGYAPGSALPIRMSISNGCNP